MNKTAIKSFAIAARRKLIDNTKLRASMLGITEEGISPKLNTSTAQIEYYVDDRNPITGSDITKRARLVDELHRRVVTSDQKTAFNDLIEEVAYTWFNRLIAIRFMEVNDYLPSRTRVLSSSEGRNEPDIMLDPRKHESFLGHFNAEEEQLIDQARDTEATIDMDRLYRMLFIKQANALNDNLPHLFEKTNDYAELLFTPNYHDGVIKSLINDIPEADFDVSKGGQVEIIGWLYQYYNTEPKDIALKKKKYTESDISAVTQLFTPDWIVKYMVQNSLGRYWIDLIHDKGDNRTVVEIANSFNWSYFMPAAEQDEQTALIIEKKTTDLSAVNIEDITLVDAAMGSGHILVYAFEVFMQLYTSEGYSKRDAAELIIQKNLFGFDIDTRAFQLSYFALMMEARQYNRRFLDKNIQPNTFEILESADIQTADFKQLIETSDEEQDLTDLLTSFKYGNDYGSLIHFNHQLNWNNLKKLTQPVNAIGQLSFNDIKLERKQKKLSQLINLAKLLSRTYTIGVMNPPYMGSGKMNSVLGTYVKKKYPDSKSDLFSAFMERVQSLTVSGGYYAMITQHAWMFLSSFEKLRKKLRQDTLINMAHLGTRAFEEIDGEVVQSTTFVFRKHQINNYIGTYERLVDFNSQSAKEHAYLEAVKNTSVSYLYRTNQANFEKIPGSPIAYWASDNLIHDFEIGTPMEKIVEPRQGLATADNKRFLRQWFEVAVNNISFHSKNISDSVLSGKKWFPCNKGGNYRKWYGNYDYVVNWENNGQEIRNFTDSYGKVRSRPQNSNYYFREAITWPKITSGKFNARFRIQGSIHETAGNEAFCSNHQEIMYILALLGTKIVQPITNILNPTINMQIGDFCNFPVLPSKQSKYIENTAVKSIDLSKLDWDAFEFSWDFSIHPMLSHIADDKQKDIDGKLQNAFSIWKDEAQTRFNQLKSNEEELNRIFIDLYGLNDELTPEVADKDVSVRLADEVCDIKSFLSYFIGVVFGRYSLDEDGLAFAGGNWDITKYHQFVPNKDNLLMLNDEQYFDDEHDIIVRLKEFLGSTFGSVTISENMAYIASVVGKKADTVEAQIRRYFVEDFFKDHKQIYQKRPIYWEFNSGRQNGFKALMYLHRYDQGELAMIRTDYLHPLQGKYENRLNQLQQLVSDEPVAKRKKQFEKEIKHIAQQLNEIKKFDPVLKHLADEQISLDLDDGVLVNYDKLQDSEHILTKL